MSHFEKDEEYPGLARYQRALAALHDARAKAVAAAQLCLGIPPPIKAWDIESPEHKELQYYVEKALDAEKEFNDANFCYTHPDRAHERG